MTSHLSDAFDQLTQRSRSLHGHMYVLPVAVWILESGRNVVTPSEAMPGLGGRADRARIIEALVKLTEIDALVELPRVDRKNAPRAFERLNSTYWDLAASYAAEARAGGGSRGRA